MEYQLDLQGAWQVYLGDCDAPPTHFLTQMLLPATTETAGIGVFAPDQNNIETLSRVRPYTGAAWFCREVQIPRDWVGMRIFLELERTKYTSIWVDGVKVSENHETIVPQVHELGEAAPFFKELTAGAPTADLPIADLPTAGAGSHTLAICVSNDLLQDPTFPATLMRGHQYTDDTQTNWNGIIGYLRLSAKPTRQITHCKTIGNVQTKQIECTIALENVVEPCTATIAAELTHILHGEKHRLIGSEAQITLPSGSSNIIFNLPVDSPSLWDEFSPSYYNLTLTLHHSGDSCDYTTRAAFKDQAVIGKQIRLSGIPIYLRGTVDCAIFPQTGYAPTTRAAWLELLSTMQSYGINHYRFHSWCPTRAAFEAADQLGIYLQVELPNFATDFSSRDSRLGHFLHDQALKILHEFGNHPSFFLFATGNEMTGAPDCFRALIRECRAYRGDILYTQGANNFLEDPLCIAEDDCWIIMRTSKTANIRASFSHNDMPLGHLQSANLPSTITTYDDALALSPLPLISHEIGQFQTFPNVDEISDYTGPLYPTAVAWLKDELARKGLLHYADDFVHASGKLAVDCYREDIEALMRTGGMSGFQLLGIQDFPGQGTAMVGILDSLLKSKNLITPAKWREFCSAQVLLAKFGTYTYFAGDTVTADILISNFGATVLNGVPTVSLWLGNERIAQQTLPAAIAPRGALQSLGRCALALPPSMSAAELELRIAYQGIQTTYPLWVYPSEEITTPPTNLLVTSRLTEVEHIALKEGKTVVLFSADASETHSVEGFFAPDFWCLPMFAALCDQKGIPSAPGTMGLLIDSGHPMLAAFPTRNYAQWQWHAISYHARPLIMDQFTPAIKPIVRVIDHFTRNHDLALALEASVEGGKLLIIASDVLAHQDLPNIRAFYQSVLSYAEKMPTPETTLDFAALQALYTN